MLKLADEKDFSAIRSFCKGDLIGTRIECYCLAYGFNMDFFNVWLQYVDDEIKAVAALFYDSITLKIGDDCFAEEIVGFCNMLPCNEIISNIPVSHNPTVKKAYLFRGNADGYSMKDVDEEYYKKLYTLVSENISGSFADSKQAYLSWLSDFTYRKRRGLSRSKGYVEKDTLYSSVITSSETSDAAVLSAVATSLQARGNGLGRSTVLAMVNELRKENKDVYVIALNESAEGFYEHIGFEYTANIYFLKK